MRRSLRKGRSSVYFHYEHVGDSIGAKEFEAELRGDTAVLRFTLSPVDENQRMDEERLLTDTPKQIDLSDDYVIDNLNDFLVHQRDVVKAVEVEVLSSGRIFRFSVVPGAAAMNVLPLMVKPIAS